MFDKEDLREISLALEVQMKRVSRYLRDLSHMEESTFTLQQIRGQPKL
jgi:hypothetical protein